MTEVAGKTEVRELQSLEVIEVKYFESAFIWFLSNLKVNVGQALENNKFRVNEDFRGVIDFKSQVPC